MSVELAQTIIPSHFQHTTHTEEQRERVAVQLLQPSCELTFLPKTEGGMWGKLENQERAGCLLRRGYTVVQLIQEKGSSGVPSVQRALEQPSYWLEHFDDSSRGEGLLNLGLALSYTVMHQVKGCKLLCQQADKEKDEKKV